MSLDHYLVKSRRSPTKHQGNHSPQALSIWLMSIVERSAMPLTPTLSNEACDEIVSDLFFILRYICPISLRSVVIEGGRNKQNHPACLTHYSTLLWEKCSASTPPYSNKVTLWPPILLNYRINQSTGTYYSEDDSNKS